MNRRTYICCTLLLLLSAALLPACTTTSKSSRVKGVLLDGGREPAADAQIFLWPAVKTPGGAEITIPESWPQAETRRSGAFVVRNVPPGSYVLVSANQVIPLLDSKGEIYVLDIEPGQVIDLGLMYPKLLYSGEQVLVQELRVSWSTQAIAVHPQGGENG